VTLDAWKVPYENSRPVIRTSRLTAAIWFVGQAGHYLAVFDPNNASFAKHALADRPGPHNLVIASDGIVWYTGNLEATSAASIPRTSARTTRPPIPDADPAVKIRTRSPWRRTGTSGSPRKPATSSVTST
jgi:streptogramin lyase